MKAAANGSLNLSTLDGWWEEAYRSGIGWALGHGETHNDVDYQDQVEAAALYDLLERDVIPMFYERSANGLPRRWIAYMKAAISNLCHNFNTHRMVQAYTERAYLPADARYGQLTGENMARAKALAAWKTYVREQWPQVHIQSVDAEGLIALRVGEQAQVEAKVNLGELSPTDVNVELYWGPLAANGQIAKGETVSMTCVEGQEQAAGSRVYRADAVVSHASGLHGYTVRVVPHHPDLVTPWLPGLITWAGSDGELKASKR